MNRTQEREQAFIIMFDKAFHPELLDEEILAMAVESEFVRPNAFTEEILQAVSDNNLLIDQTIRDVAVGWSLNRMTKVSLAILRLAVAEILFRDDIPASVSINEAVELAKKYAGKEDSAFINGILGTIARNAENSSAEPDGESE